MAKGLNIKIDMEEIIKSHANKIQEFQDKEVMKYLSKEMIEFAVEHKGGKVVWKN